MDAFEYVLRHNSWQTGVIALGVALGGFVVLTTLRRQVLQRLTAFAAATAVWWDDMLVSVIGQTRSGMLAAVSTLIALLYLDLPQPWTEGLRRGAATLLLLQCGLWTHHAIGFWLRQRMRHSIERGDGASSSSLAVAGFALRLVLWSVVLVLLLDQLGFDVTTLVASLGI